MLTTVTLKGRGRSMRFYAIAALLLMGVLVLARFTILRGGSEDTGSSPQDVLGRLPEVQPVEAVFGPRSSAGPLGESFAKASHVVVVKVESESTSSDAGSQERLSGTHSVGLRRYHVTTVDDLKGGAPASLEIVQSAQWYNGVFFPDSANPPIEIGKTYLVFLLPASNGTDLLVAPPSIHMVIDGRLYWAGARMFAAADGSFGANVKFQAADARFGLWGVRVEEAVGEILKSP
jgi:hypothetical protein